MTTNTESTPTPTSSPSTKTKNITKIKAPKSHQYRTIDPSQVHVIGLDTDKSMHTAELAELQEKHPRFVADMAEGVWCLEDTESNESPPADNLVTSITAKGKVEQAGKLIPVPLTEATNHLAYVDGDGEVWPHYFAVVYGRKRTRSVRDLGMAMIYKIESSDLREAASDMLIENLVRRTFAPTVEAGKLAKLAAEGLSHEEIAAKIGDVDNRSKAPSARTVENKIRLTKLAAAVAKMVDSGELGITAGYAISHLPKSKQGDAARQTIENRLTANQVRDLVKEITGEAPTTNKPLDTGNLPSSPAPTTDTPQPDSGTPPAPTSETPKATEPETPKAPTFESIKMTKTERPRAAGIEEMIEYLGGERSPLAKRAAVKLAVAALHWVRGNMSEDEFIMKVAALHKVDVDDLAPANPEPETQD